MVDAGVGLVVRLLGSVSASVDGVDLDLGPAGPRSLFAALALRANTVVTRDELTDALWGEHAPRTADGNIYSYVSNLRKVLEPGRSGGRLHDVLVRSRGGYMLALRPGGLDLALFEGSAVAARAAMAAGDHATALSECDAALSMWRGHALGGVVGPLAELERDRLGLRRLEVQELRCTALLETGSAATAVGELAALIAGHPLNERLHEMQMLAMCRSGRQADALRVYQQLRDRLAEELGVDPGPALRELHQLVLAGDPMLSGGPPVIVPAPRRAMVGNQRGVPGQLPHSVPVLAGRTAEMARLRELCAPAMDGVSASSVVISAIDGIPGVGKTAIALHLAHEIAPSFPDGQLFIDLRGFDPLYPPLAPEEALGHLVRGLGAESDPVVDNLGEKAALYRSLLSGRKVLVVLDNAASVEQVRPLLPGTAGCLALVTSRNRMAGLVARDGASRLAVDNLSLDGSLELLRGVLGADIVDAEPDAAAELGERCGHLPLALRIAAERIAGGDYLALSEMVDELRVAQHRLDTLSTPDDPLSTVRAVFSWSYQALKPEDARAFRLLSVHPGREYDVDVATAVFGTDRLTAKRHLESLDRRSLLQRAGSHRYRMHDLLRVYAAECAELDEPATTVDDTVERLIRWYIATSVAAREVLMPGFARVGQYDAAEQGARAFLRTYDDAIYWANEQLSTIEAVVRLAMARGRFELATKVAVTLSVLYHCTSRWSDWLRLTELGQIAATRMGDDRSRGFLYNDAGQAAHQLGHEDEALRYLTAAVELLTSLPDQNESAVVDNLAVAYATIAVYTNSIDEMTTNWDKIKAHGTKSALGAMSMACCAVLSRTGKHDEALEYGRKSVALYGEVGATYTLGQALVFLGEACAVAHELDQADRHFTEALGIWRQHHDRQRSAETMHAVARVRHRMGRGADVRTLLREALMTIDECGYTRANEQQRKQILTLLDELSGDQSTR